MRELRRKLAAGGSAHEEQQLVFRQMVMAQEDALRLVSRQLHDGVGQRLTLLALDLRRLGGGHIEDCTELVRSLQVTIESLAKEVHDLACHLRPASLEELGLPRSLDGFLGRWSNRSGIASEFQSAGWPPGRGNSPVEVALYRIIGDALEQIVRPAGAQHVSIVLQQRGDRAVVIIENDGKKRRRKKAGASAQRTSSWRSLRERVALVDGEITIEDNPGRGTTIFVRVPLPAEETQPR